MRSYDHDDGTGAPNLAKRDLRICKLLGRRLVGAPLLSNLLTDIGQPQVCICELKNGKGLHEVDAQTLDIMKGKRIRHQRPFLAVAFGTMMVPPCGSIVAKLRECRELPCRAHTAGSFDQHRF
ncbi:hypothetical protein Tco_1106499 [Tanacetum coccineum]